MISNKLKEDYKANLARSFSWKGLVVAYFNNPAFRLLLKFRIAQSLYHKGGLHKVFAKLIWNNIVNNFGCYFSLVSIIEGGLRLPHPVGIVIGGDVCIKKNVTIYQHVTIGRINQNNPIVPIIEENNIIYANSLILGKIHTKPNQITPALTVNKNK